MLLQPRRLIPAIICELSIAYSNPPRPRLLRTRSVFFSGAETLSRGIPIPTEGVLTVLTVITAVVARTPETARDSPAGIDTASRGHAPAKRADPFGKAPVPLPGLFLLGSRCPAATALPVSL
jgi:hypothetical protein